MRRWVQITLAVLLLGVVLGIFISPITALEASALRYKHNIEAVQYLLQALPAAIAAIFSIAFLFVSFLAFANMIVSASLRPMRELACQRTC